MLTCSGVSSSSSATETRGGETKAAMFFSVSLELKAGYVIDLPELGQSAEKLVDG